MRGSGRIFQAGGKIVLKCQDQNKFGVSENKNGNSMGTE